MAALPQRLAERGPAGEIGQEASCVAAASTLPGFIAPFNREKNIKPNCCSKSHAVWFIEDSPRKRGYRCRPGYGILIGHPYTTTRATTCKYFPTRTRYEPDKFPKKRKPNNPTNEIKTTWRLRNASEENRTNHPILHFATLPSIGRICLLCGQRHGGELVLGRRKH